MYGARVLLLTSNIPTRVPSGYVPVLSASNTRRALFHTPQAKHGPRYRPRESRALVPPQRALFSTPQAEHVSRYRCGKCALFFKRAACQSRPEEKGGLNRALCTGPWRRRGHAGQHCEPLLRQRREPAGQYQDLGSACGASSRLCLIPSPRPAWGFHPKIPSTDPAILVTCSCASTRPRARCWSRGSPRPAPPPSDAFS